MRDFPANPGLDFWAFMYSFLNNTTLSQNEVSLEFLWILLCFRLSFKAWCIVSSLYISTNTWDTAQDIFSSRSSCNACRVWFPPNTYTTPPPSSSRALKLEDDVPTKTVYCRPVLKAVLSSWTWLLSNRLSRNCSDGCFKFLTWTFTPLPWTIKQRLSTHLLLKIRQFN